MKERRGSRKPVRDFPGIHLVTHARQSNNAPISQEPATELQLNSTIKQYSISRSHTVHKFLRFAGILGLEFQKCQKSCSGLSGDPNSSPGSIAGCNAHKRIVAHNLTECVL